MKLIVGLGNPGEKYQNTRHNLGFIALDELLRKLESVEQTFWDEKKDLKSNIKQIKLRTDEQRTTNDELLLVKPTTFMNSSGFSVAKVLNYYKIPTQDLIVIHDDLDIPFGKIRVRFGGAAAGHHGVESIIDVLGTDKFLRVRLGIGRQRDERLGKKKRKDLDRYVLAPFSAKDRNEIKHMTKEAIRAIELILKRGIEIYMSRYNKS